MEREDVGRLRQFVGDVQEDMQFVVSRIDLLVPVPRDLHELIDAAWVDVTPRFQDIKEYLDGRRHQDLKLGEALRERGLVGSQLKLKLRVYKERRGEFRDRWAKFEGVSDQEKAMKKPSIIDVTRRLFDIIDRILRSLGFIPGTDAVDEIKGVIENIIS